MSVIFKKSLNIMTIMMVTLMCMLPFVTQANAATTGSETDYSLTIYKYKQDPIDPNNPDGTGADGQTATGETVEGVTFELTKTHAFDPATSKWTEVTGATAITGTTDATGKIVFTADQGLELGRYEVQETAGPANVVLNTTKYSVDIPMTSDNGTDLNYQVAIYPKNEVLRGAVELLKTGEEDEALAGAEFELYKVGTPDEKIGDKYVTDADGKLLVEGLLYGDYYFVETKAPAGHLLDTTKIEFTINQDYTVTETGEKTGLVTAAMKNFDVPTIEKDVEGTTHLNINRDKQYTYNLKLNLPGNIAEYKEYKVTDILDTRLTYDGSWTVTGTDVSNIEFATSTTDAGNEVLTWTVKDITQLVAGEQLVISFKSKIKADAVLVGNETGIPNYAILEFDNNHGVDTKPVDPNNPPGPNTPPDPEDPTNPPTTPPVTVKPTEGGLQVIKVDASDNNIKLAGAEFKLTTDKEGNDVVVAKGLVKVNGVETTGNLENLTTDANGQFLVENLAEGTYYLHETKAPTYINEDGETKSYRLLTSPEEVKISGDASITEVTVENSKSAWYLPQTGGLGTILFTVVGLAIMGLALFVFRRNKNQVA